MSEPIVRRKFILFDPVENSNKFYLIEFWDDGKTLCTWGRIGKSQQSESFTGWTSSMVDKKIKEKIKKGYNEVDLHKPDIHVVDNNKKSVTVNGKVADFLKFIFDEAGEYIKSYLAVGVDSLSKAQIDKGREQLKAIQLLKQTPNTNIFQAKIVKEYLNTIPTQLPMKYDWDYEVGNIVKNLPEQEDRLNQLEAALATYQSSQTGNDSLLSQLGDVEILNLENGTEYDKIVDYVKRTSGGYRVVDSAFVLKIKSEREAYEKETKGSSNIQHLVHGTKTKNVRHILRTGLIIPKIPANGRRIGDGIYFADRFERSLGYSGSNRDQRHILFLADVKLGKYWATTGTYNGQQAPKGYDSVQVTGSWSGKGDEFAVYINSQQTLKYIVVLR